MKSFLLNLAAIISLMLAVAVCVLWARSVYVDETFRWSAERWTIRDSYGIGSAVGHLSFFAEHEPGQYAWIKPAIEHEASSNPSVTPLSDWFLRAPVRVVRNGYAGIYIIIADWLLLLLTLPLPLVVITRFRRQRRQRHRISNNLCPICGYDLRATPDRCPECGAVPASLS